MQKKLFFKLIQLGITGLLFNTSLYAATPLWTYSAPTPAILNVSPGSLATVQYTVTNQSQKSRYLVLKPLPGVTASACYLAKKGSCTLTLTIDGNQIPQKGLHTGPVLCEQNNLNQCYQPQLSNLLHINYNAEETATIQATPTNLALEQGGTAQTITVSNTSAVPIQNLQAIIPPSSTISLDPINTTCTDTLSANSTCQYSFLPGAQIEPNTTIVINGSNVAKALNITVSVTAVVLNISPNTLDFAVGSSGSLTITNTSTNTSATNFQVDIPPSSLLIDASSTCTIGGTIAPLGTCTIVLTTAANVPPQTNIVTTIQGDNTNTLSATVTTTATSLEVTSPTTGQILNVDGTSTLSIAVKNTGQTTANNVKIILPSGTGMSSTPSSCNIVADTTCNFTLSSSEPNIAQRISIQGDNTNLILTPYIAFRYGGGLVFSKQQNTPSAGQLQSK